MQRESFFIGNKEFQASKIGAFKANSLILKIQKIVLPVLGGMGGKNLGDMDTKDAFAIISEKLDESVMTDIILPMFQLSQVACTSESPAFKIDSPTAFDKAFGDADGLADMYALIFEVLKFNFGAFFIKLRDHFGGESGKNQAAA